MDFSGVYYEIVVLAFVIVFVMQYVGGISINKFVSDNSK